MEVCEVKIEDGLFKIVRVSEDYYEDKVVVYVEVKNERYFIEIYLMKEFEIVVDFVWIELGNWVYLIVILKRLIFKEFLSFIRKFELLIGWFKGDLRKYGKLRYDFSWISFELIRNEVYGLDEKLELLFNELEKDIEGV